MKWIAKDTTCLVLYLLLLLLFVFLFSFPPIYSEMSLSLVKTIWSSVLLSYAHVYHSFCHSYPQHTSSFKKKKEAVKQFVKYEYLIIFHELERIQICINFFRLHLLSSDWDTLSFSAYFFQFDFMQWWGIPAVVITEKAEGAMHKKMN
jgi:hypothetical protein